MDVDKLTALCPGCEGCTRSPSPEALPIHWSSSKGVASGERKRRARSLQLMYSPRPHLTPVHRGLVSSSPTPGENGIDEGKLSCFESPRAVNSYMIGHRGCLIHWLLEPAWPVPISVILLEQQRRRPWKKRMEDQSGHPTLQPCISSSARGRSSQERQSLGVNFPKSRNPQQWAREGAELQGARVLGLGASSRGWIPVSVGGQVGWGPKARLPCDGETGCGRGTQDRDRKFSP